MDRNTIRGERERLDHQRGRIEQILASKIVSADMDRDLRRRLDEITHQLTLLGMAELSAAMLPAPIRFEQPVG